MTQDEISSVCKLVRNYVTVFAEVRALRAVFQVATMTGRPVSEWQHEVDLLKQTPQYRSLLEEFEPEISQIRLSDDESSLIQLLRKINEQTLPG